MSIYTMYITVIHIVAHVQGLFTRVKNLQTPKEKKRACNSNISPHR